MEPKDSQEMIDSTDSFEAVMVMKGVKNFLFWLLLAALLVAQGVFWMNRFGLIDTSECILCPAADPAPTCPAPCRPISILSAPLPLTAAVIAEQVERVVQEADLQTSAPEKADEPAVIIVPAPPALETPESDVPKASRDVEWDRLKISCRTAFGLMRVCNFLMFMAALLYGLTLLINLKISLIGKLGGINHIARAFFWSLCLLVFLTPWQTLLPAVMVGAMYTPSELLCGAWAKADTSTFWKVLLYLRFTGLWLIVLWLLLCAQSRSIKWTRATLRRLGMSR